MLKSVVALSLLAVPFFANAAVDAVLVCTNAQTCAVEAKTLEAFQKLGGLGSCGVVPGEYTVKVVDRNGKLVGYKCAWGSSGGLF